MEDDKKWRIGRPRPHIHDCTSTLAIMLECQRAVGDGMNGKSHQSGKEETGQQVHGQLRLLTPFILGRETALPIPERKTERASVALVVQNQANRAKRRHQFRHGDRHCLDRRAWPQCPRRCAQRAIAKTRIDPPGRLSRSGCPLCGVADMLRNT
jgi:hypothetical protein